VRYGTITDTRDSKIYKTVEIGNQTWMAQNLNYQPSTGNSWCYDNNNANCNSRYGRLYDWNTAMAGSKADSSKKIQGICPSDWHLPSGNEWDILGTFAGGNSVAGKKLKAKYMWASGGGKIDYNGPRTDDYGFSALPGGYRDILGRFHDVGEEGYWWTATEAEDNSGDGAYGRSLSKNYPEIYWGHINWCRDDRYYLCGSEKVYGYSVRCVKN